MLLSVTARLLLTLAACVGACLGQILPLCAPFCCLTTSNTSTALQTNGPAVAGSPTLELTNDTYYQVYFNLSLPTQLATVQLFPAAFAGSLLLTAGVYNITSDRLQQTAVTTVSGADFSATAARPLSLPLLSPVNLTAGFYSVAWWFSPLTPAMPDAVSNSTVPFYSTNSSDGNPMYYQTAGFDYGATYPDLAYMPQNGSLPFFVAALNPVGELPYDGITDSSLRKNGSLSPSAVAPLLRLVGSSCANSVVSLPSSLIDLNTSIARVLTNIQRYHAGFVPAMAATVIQLPTASSYRYGTTHADICPWVEVANVAVGVRRIDAVRPEPVTLYDKWHLGSDTKSMTALMMQTLLQGGVFDLTTTVHDVFPYLPFSDRSQKGDNTSCTCADIAARPGYFGKSAYTCGMAIHQSWQNVTIAHLLTHTSGLGYLEGQWVAQYNPEQYRLEAANATGRCTGYTLPSRHYYMMNILSDPLWYYPNTTTTEVPYQYCNQDFELLGLMLEEYWQRPWEQAITEQLFQPLGMPSAGFGVTEGPLPLNETAMQPFGHAYNETSGTMYSISADNPKAEGPAGTVHVPMLEWSKFIACHVQAGRNLTALGLPPTGQRSTYYNASTNPYYLQQQQWQYVQTPYIFPGYSRANSGAYTLIGMTNTSQANALGSRVQHAGTNTLNFADVRVHRGISQPVAILIALNSFHYANPGEEADRALEQLYISWAAQGMPQPSAAVPGVLGDPQFTGLLGQSFQVHGLDGAVYALISDRLVHVNARFAFVDAAECLRDREGRPLFVCWSHPGSYLTELAVITGPAADVGRQSHAVLLAGPAKRGFLSVTLDGQDVLARQAATGTSGGSGGSQLRVQALSARLVLVEQAGLYSLLVENSDGFLNVVRVEVSDWRRLTHDVRSHGLLGQTWRRRQGKPYEGDVDDYAVSGDELLGCTFVHSPRNCSALHA